jgi:hypothetical protein
MTLVSPPILTPPVPARNPSLYWGEARSTHQDTSDLVQRPIQDLLANGVVTTRIVVGGVLLATDQQLGVEQLSVVTGTDLIDRAGVQVDKDRSGNVFAGAGLGEDGIELTAVVERLGIGIGTAVLLEAVLEEVPADCLRLGVVMPGRDRAQRTAPRHCSPAGFRPGRCGGEESAWKSRQLSVLLRTPRLLSLNPGGFRGLARDPDQTPFRAIQEKAVFIYLASGHLGSRIESPRGGGVVVLVEGRMRWS